MQIYNKSTRFYTAQNKKSQDHRKFPTCLLRSPQYIDVITTSLTTKIVRF